MEYYKVLYFQNITAQSCSLAQNLVVNLLIWQKLLIFVQFPIKHPDSQLKYFHKKWKVVLELLMSMFWTVQKFLVRKKCICFFPTVSSSFAFTNKIVKILRFFLNYMFCKNLICTQLIHQLIRLLLSKGVLFERIEN